MNIEKVKTFLWTPRGGAVLGGALSAVSFAAGGATAYILTKKNLETKYEQLAKEEIEAAKQFYKRLHKTGDADEVLTPEQVLENLHGKEAVTALRRYQGLPPVATEEELIVDPEESAAYLEQVEGRVVKQEVIRESDGTLRMSTIQESTNVFADSDSNEQDIRGWDYETELARRSGDNPYVITQEEFFQGEKDYEQISLTYYEGDDVLTDDQNGPIPDTDATVGDDNLVRFGHGTKDENAVYVRNERRELDFEIVRSFGKFSEEVLGFLEHSNNNGMRKFRGHDD